MKDVSEVVARAMFPEDYVLMDACPGGIDCHVCKGMKKDHAPKVKRVLLAVLDHYCIARNIGPHMAEAWTTADFNPESGATANVIAAGMQAEAKRIEG